MPRSRLWVKLDASYYNDAALLEAGERAEVLFVRAIALSKQLLSDGILTRFQLESCGLRTLNSRISALVRVGLWTPIDPPDGGEVRAWQIRSYLRYNTSAQRVEEISELRREAGRKGGRPRQTESKLPSKSEANGKQLVTTMYNPEAEAEAELTEAVHRPAELGENETHIGNRLAIEWAKCHLPIPVQYDHLAARAQISRLTANFSDQQILSAPAKIQANPDLAKWAGKKGYGYLALKTRAGVLVLQEVLDWKPGSNGRPKSRTEEKLEELRRMREEERRANG